jgi:hypothetical protein
VRLSRPTTSADRCRVEFLPSGWFWKKENACSEANSLLESGAIRQSLILLRQAAGRVGLRGAMFPPQFEQVDTFPVTLVR